MEFFYSIFKNIFFYLKHGVTYKNARKEWIIENKENIDEEYTSPSRPASAT